MIDDTNKPTFTKIETTIISSITRIWKGLTDRIQNSATELTISQDLFRW